MSELAPKLGYLRTKVTYQAQRWRFEMLSEHPRTAIVTIETAEGSLDVGLSEVEARQLRDDLNLFLSNALGKS